MNTDNAANSGIPANAVSVYGQDGAMDDFPVLKAFQQYIDAEQNKARKRMVTLSIFFGVLICAVVAVFMVVLLEVSRRNQALNDKMVEYAMRERDRQASEAVAARQQNAAQEAASTAAAVKALTETLASMERRMEEQNAKTAQAVAQKAEEPSPGQIDRERKMRESEEKLIKARALLDAEKKMLEEEKERLRKEEVERQRRRLYPEYYGEAPAAKPRQDAQPQQQAPSRQPRRQITDDDIADILKEAGSSAADQDETPAAPPPKAKSSPPPDLGTPIEYFKDNEYRIPVDVKGKSAKWRVPLD